MSHGKTNELIGTSNESFEKAISEILNRANNSLRGVRSIEVIDKHVSVSESSQLSYHVRAHLKFDMAPPDQLHL